MRLGRTLLLLPIVLCATSANGGTFHLSDLQPFFEPYIVVHPAGYDGTGGVLQVRVCAAPETRFGVLSAIETWNELVRTTGNCTDCRLWEQGPSKSDSPFSVATVALHELGHCAMGLGHINWNDDETPTSYSHGVDVGFYTDGADGIRGSSDDGVAPPTGAQITHWFRGADNDPLVVDTTTIDSSTYTRRKIDLPAGHSWSASGNLGVALLLGHLDTQAIMYSAADPLQRYHGLAADEVNTAEFAMSGLDETAGTEDDYTVELVYVPDCEDAEIEVRYLPFDPGINAAGLCTAYLTSLAPPNELEIHHALIPFGGNSRILLDINSDKDWDFSVFEDGFEDGTTDAWDSVSP